MTSDFRRPTADFSIPRFLLLLILLASCSKPESPKSLDSLRVVILLTGDLHGRVDRLPSLASYIAGQRRKATVVHVDSGDFFQGTPEGDLTRGRVVLDAYNAMGVDALALGNHDFDLGPKTTEELAGASRFPFLAANLRAAWVRPSLVRRDLRIEILGLAPDAMDRLSTRRAREGLNFEPAEKSIARHPWTPGVARILLTHLGLERDRALPLNGIAAVLGGHTHVSAVETLPGGAILVHPGSHGESVGRLELELDPSTGAVRSARGEVIDVPDGRDAAIERIVEAGAGGVRRAMDERIGRLDSDLPRGGPDFDGTSSPLGHHIADLAREAAGAEAAVILRSSIRSSLFAGPIRRRDLYEATPFPDTVVSVSVSGARLRSALERAVANDERLLVEVAGISMAYDRSAAAGRRIRRLDVAGTPVDSRRRYRIATLSFMIEPGGLFAGGADARDTGRTLLDAHVEFFRANPRVRAPKFHPRITRAGH